MKESVQGRGQSPHPKGYVWHIALSMQGLTARTRKKSFTLLKMLVSTTDGTNLMHEGFDVDDPSKYTRLGFAWSCSLLRIRHALP